MRYEHGRDAHCRVVRLLLLQVVTERQLRGIGDLLLELQINVGGGLSLEH